MLLYHLSFQYSPIVSGLFPSINRISHSILLPRAAPIRRSRLACILICSGSTYGILSASSKAVMARTNLKSYVRIASMPRGRIRHSHLLSPHFPHKRKLQEYWF